MNGLERLFYLDTLSLTMMLLISLVGLTVINFSMEYLQGDQKRRTILARLMALILNTSVMVSADHILLLIVTWSTNNLILVSLIAHKRAWLAAKEAAYLAAKNFAVGCTCLCLSLSFLYYATEQTSIQKLLNTTMDSTWALLGALFLLLAAMSQSAIWPFHRWLISSLNSPTPVSAAMHAGLINGGGFLLTRFAPIFLEQPELLNIIFILGITTAILGGIWQLIQHDIKRMLACSTMSQMGFMVAQCGLGLFPSAIAHLYWHGCFKAYLFLNHGSEAQQTNFTPQRQPTMIYFLLALCCGTMSMPFFFLANGKYLSLTDTTLFLAVLIWITGIQFALGLIKHKGIYHLLSILLLTCMISGLYGFSVYWAETLLSPVSLPHPQTLNIFHITALIILGGIWFLGLIGYKNTLMERPPRWLLSFYVQVLNASQPDPRTITANRHQYQYE